MAANGFESTITQTTQAAERIGQLERLRTSCKSAPVAKAVEMESGMNINVRSAKVADADIIMQVCNEVWGDVWQSEKQMFIDRITAFPECGIVVGEIDGRIEGYVSIQLANEDVIRLPTWDESTDFGHFTKSHNPSGDWLHGAGLAVTLKGCRAGLTEKLIQFLYEYAIAEQKKGCRFITRIPGYYNFKDKISPEEYVCIKRNGRSIDPELRVLGRYGFSVVEPPVIYTNYVEGGGDPKSCGLSVLIERLNPNLES